jgi:hypothetical protein
LLIQIRWPNRLGWKAPRKPPDEFLAELRQYKAEMITAFSCVASKDMARQRLRRKLDR